MDPSVEKCSVAPTAIGTLRPHEALGRRRGDREVTMDRTGTTARAWGGWIVAVVALAAGWPDGPRAAETPASSVTVGATPIATVVDYRGDTLVGPMPEIWEGLARRIGITTTFVRVPSIVSLIDDVGAGRIDVGLGPVAITEERERTLDFTHPVFHSGMRIVVREQRGTGLLDAARSLASWRLLSVLGAVAALALLSGHLLWWVERGDNPDSFPRDYRRGVGEALWWIVSAVVTGGCDDKHVDGILGRAIALAWMIGGIGLVAAFTSVLTATMTADQVAGIIHGPRDLAGRSVGVQEGAVTIGVVKQRGGFPREYPTLREALAALDAGEIKAVVSANEVVSALVAELGRPRLRVVGPLFDVFDFGIVLPTGSLLREPLNKALLQMREEGEITRIRERWLGKHD
ncbi:MAG: transporter substrate-binding domain-containing protein [Planctomycetes bacterium]|nr:transporter substrate-binding domain-containing protein [Planctomycetota bacterium]